ncbi:hypothetical protein [Rhizosphaericola mali]|uniref:DUF4397 domain-containing protein n=1 Tax=Rhizosphaericola mali TaxID=2545455 RepID=A0A5P2G4T1_9BACT|nr:hypothetical protein [Rhizosphaericola mali]QES89698.1 hypothetical protein E0W69_013845 [Rhizosphaericola mali]
MKKQFSRLFLLCFIPAAIYSCSKSDSTNPSDNGNDGLSIGDTVSLSNAYTKGYLTLIANKTFYVGNFTQGTGVSTTDTSLSFATKNSTFYYSLTENQGDTTNYDIKFTSSYALSVDTSKYKLTFINKTFDNVTDSTGGTNILTGLAGMNNTYPSTDSVPTAAGWYIYNATTHIVGAYMTRTYIITNKSTGNYYKFHIVSMYSGAQPNATTAALNFPYYHFEYMKMN